MVAIWTMRHGGDVVPRGYSKMVSFVSVNLF